MQCGGLWWTINVKIICSLILYNIVTIDFTCKIEIYTLFTRLEADSVILDEHMTAMHPFEWNIPLTMTLFRESMRRC